MRYLFHALAGALVALICGCSPHAAGPPLELAGLWSRGEGACAAQLGVTFSKEAITAQTPDGRAILFKNPVYELEQGGPRFRVRIRYALPSVPGRVTGRGRFGVLILARDAAGWLHPVTHHTQDTRTGSARLRLAQPYVTQALTLVRCGANGFGLRGSAE